MNRNTTTRMITVVGQSENWPPKLRGDIAGASQGCGEEARAHPGRSRRHPPPKQGSPPARGSPDLGHLGSPLAPGPPPMTSSAAANRAPSRAWERKGKAEPMVARRRPDPLPNISATRSRARTISWPERRVGPRRRRSRLETRSPSGLAEVGEESAQATSRAELDGEAQAVSIAPLGRDQLPVGVIEVEETVQVRARGRLGVAAIAGRLLISEELNRHAPRRYEQERNAKSGVSFRCSSAP